ncbi:MAG: transporter substrate-binding domain-containing protein [Alphaproteobacteria bacterium]|nr:transporter substrate-binding domain-containing protein [Alphaproteobacteria bacterium]
MIFNKQKHLSPILSSDPPPVGRRYFNLSIAVVHFFVVILSSLLGLGISSGVMAGSIVFAYTDSAPRYIVNQTQLGGICGDIYRELGQVLSANKIDIKLVHLSLEQNVVFENLLSGRSHVYCGVERDKYAEAAFIYSTRPVYQTSDVLVVPSDVNINPKSVDELRNSSVVIGVFQNSTSRNYLRMQYGLQLNDSYRDLSVALKQVAEKRGANVFFHEDIELYHHLHQQPLPLRVLPAKFHTRDQWLIYSRKMPSGYIQKMEEALLHMELEGKLAEIQCSYRCE